MKAIKKLVAECFGTMVLVIFGCGSAVAANQLVSGAQIGNAGFELAITTLLISFAFGLSIVAMAYSIGNVSGCHINPAVSFSMLVSGRMSVTDFVGYVAAQFTGGMLGACVLRFILDPLKGLGTNGFEEASALGSSMLQAFAVEIILTCVFTFVILYVTSKSEHANLAGLVIALTLTLVHILGIPFTGTSVNPARSFGPALLAGGQALSQVWLFIAAPLVGAGIAGLLYRFFTAGNADKK